MIVKYSVDLMGRVVSFQWVWFKKQVHPTPPPCWAQHLLSVLFLSCISFVDTKTTSVLKSGSSQKRILATTVIESGKDVRQSCLSHNWNFCRNIKDIKVWLILKRAQIREALTFTWYHFKKCFANLSTLWLCSSLVFFLCWSSRKATPANLLVLLSQPFPTSWQPSCQPLTHTTGGVKRQN